MSQMTSSTATHVLFFDRSVGKRIPKVLQFVRIPIGITYHDQHFAQDALDDDWLPTVGERRWAVIGQDHSYHKRAAEKLAIVQYDLGVFYLWGANAKTWEQLRCIMNAYDGILDVLDNVAPPFLYRINRFGKLIDNTYRLYQNTPVSPGVVE